MSVHPMPSRAEDEASPDRSAASAYRRLRAQGVPAAEAWRRVHPRSPSTFTEVQDVDVPHAAIPVEVRSISTQVYRDGWEEFWGETPIIPLIFMTICWLAKQLFWAAIWLIRFTLRVLVGLLFFILGAIIGFRMFSR